MKMSNNPAKYEVQIKQYLRSILETSRSLRDNFFKAFLHFVKLVRSTYGTRFSYLKLAIPESGDRKILINLKLTEIGTFGSLG